MECAASGRYSVKQKEELEQTVVQSLDLLTAIEDQELQHRISEIVWKKARSEQIPVKTVLRYEKEIFYALRRQDILTELLLDPSVSEIMVNGEQHIFVERHGRIEPAACSFSSRAKLENLIQRIVSGVNRLANESVPIADARLADGSRVNVVLPPISLDGPVLTIRKFPEHPLCMEDLIRKGSVPQKWADWLQEMVQARKNMFISGGTGSGKTTFLNVLSQWIPEQERVITIEDSAELQLRTIPNLVRLEARNENLEGENAVTIRQLIRTALRMRPDRIIVGEMRGPEVLDMLQAMNTGHEGSLSTGHANSAEDMLYRMETMILMGIEIPLSAIRHQIASALDILIHLERDGKGRRYLASIQRMKGVEYNEYQMETLYRREEDGFAAEGKCTEYKE